MEISSVKTITVVMTEKEGAELVAAIRLIGSNISDILMGQHAIEMDKLAKFKTHLEGATK